MKITASIIVESCEDHDSFWDLALGNGDTTLANMLKTLNRAALFDDLSIITNEHRLIRQEQFKGSKVYSLSPRLAYNFNFLDNIKLHNECFSLLEIGKLGDIHLFMDLRYQLIQPQTIMGMFNTLMENRFAAKVIPVYQIDPHLYMEIPGEELFINLWGQQGLDRQKHPPLFRTVGCCFLHHGRLKEMQPLTFPHHIDRIEGFKITSEEDIPFIDYVMKSTPWQKQ